MNGTNDKNLNEEKDLLARGEIRTMQKDMQKIREGEAVTERERLAKIKTEEEIKMEEVRKTRAQEAAKARETAEKEAQNVEERLQKLREEQELRRKEAAMPQQAPVARPPQPQPEVFDKEEEARKRFMENIEARAEGLPVSPAVPVAPVVPAAPAPIQKIQKPLFKKPSSGQKVWVRIVLALAALALVGLIATFWYWYLVVRKPAVTAPVGETPIETPVETPIEPPQQLIIPESLITTDNTITLLVSSTNDISSTLSQALKQEIDEGALYRVLIQDQVQNKILGLSELFNAFSITPPAGPFGFFENISSDFTLFIYSQEEGNRLGFLAKITTKEGLTQAMTTWEPTMETNTANLFGLLGKDYPALVSYFKDGTYENIPFRFQTFSRQDLGLVYAISGDYLVFTTSYKSIQKVLDKLTEAPIVAKPDLEKLTVAEKVGQLFLIGIEGKIMTPDTAELLREVQPGGVLLLKKNIESESQTKQLIQDLQKASLENTGLPLLIAVDQEGGVVAPLLFGQEKTPLFAIDDLAQAYYVGLSRGAELRSLGVNLNLSPVLDVASPGDFIFGRVFQKDIQSMGALAKAIITGQKEASILTAIKHFPGYGDIASNPERELKTLTTTPGTDAFQEATEAKPELVMVSNAIYEDIDPNLPFVFSAKGINLLKDKLGDDLVIMTDDLPQGHLLGTFSLKGIVTLPIQAGVDILTFSGWSTTAKEAAQLLVEAVENNEITEERVDQSVLKILKLKNNLL